MVLLKKIVKLKDESFILKKSSNIGKPAIHTSSMKLTIANPIQA